MERRKAELVALARCLTKVCARNLWGKQRDGRDLIADAEAYAWEYAMSAPEGVDPRAIVRFALRRVRSCRRFPLSERDITHPRHPCSREPQVELDLDDLHRPGANPAKLAQLRLDLRAWLETLPPLARAVALRYALGYRTNEIAEEIGRTPGRVSQIRNELRCSWREFLRG